MSKLQQVQVAGFRVDAVRAKVRSISTDFYKGNDPAQVLLSRIGESVANLTPNEARTLAAILAAAADAAEKETP